MKKKFLFLVFLSINTTFLIGQTINLFNKTNNQIDSKIVYIGIENRFQVKGYESLERIEATNNVTLVKDNLIIRPTSTGKLPVTFITKNGKAEIIQFQVREIPNPIVMVGENNMTFIAKSNLATNRVLSIKSEQINEPFFEGYNIEYFEAELNGENFKISGNQISEQLINAIDKSKSGTKLTLSLVKIYSKKLDTHIKGTGGFIFIIK